MIALVQPRLPDRNYIPNLGILYLAGVLEEAGYPVRIYDENLDRDYFSRLLRDRPRLVGFTAVTAAVNRVGRAAAELKAAVPSTVVAAGGPHVSVLPEEVLAGGAVDYCVTGEGEYPFLDLARMVLEGRGSPAEIPNLVYRADGQIRRNPSRPFLGPEELDRLPFPPFRLLDPERVFPRIVHGLYSRGKRILPLMTSRGCPQTCTFCCRSMGKKIRTRSTENVLQEIEHLVRAYGIDEIYFEDDNFTVDRDRALAILRGIRENFPALHIKFANGLRADRVDDELLSAIREAGGYWIGFGVESGSQRVLEMMKKRLDLGKVRENLTRAKQLGFQTGANMIMGYPGETWADIRRGIRFFRELNPDSLAIVNLIPFPGTEVRRICQENGYLTRAAENYDNYYFKILNIRALISTPRLSALDLRLAVWFGYLTFYLLSWRRLKRLAGMIAGRFLRPFRSRRDEENR